MVKWKLSYWPETGGNPGPGMNVRTLPVLLSVWMLITALLVTGAREGEAWATVATHFLLGVCVVHHDSHVHCAYAPGCSIISFCCWFSSSCASIRVCCKISVCPHMAQRQCGSLLKYSLNPRLLRAWTLSSLTAEKTLFQKFPRSLLFASISHIWSLSLWTN